MTFFDETKSIVENLSFLSAPLVLLITILGLRQLKIAKDSIRINSQRESAVLAFTLVEKYFAEFTNLYDELIKLMQDCGINYEKLEQLNLHELDKIDIANVNYLEYQKLEANYTKLEYHIWNFADKLETFSVPFINKIADEQIAYNHEFMKFIQYCNLCSIQIIKAKNNSKNHHSVYECVIELYSIWKSRSESENVDNQLSHLLEIKRKMKTKKTIRPIGTT